LRPENHPLAAISRGALAALLFFARATHAQSIESSVDVGGVALRYADTLNASAATLTPRVLASWGRAVADASGTYSQFASGGRSTQGVLSASLFTPTARGLLGELAGLAGGSSHNDGTRTGVVLANGRLHFMRTRGELFLGVGGGRTWVGGGSRSVFLGEAGASTNFREVAATLTVSPVAVDDSIRYTDAQLSLFWTREKLDLGAVLGTRLGDQLTTLGGTARSWGSLSAVRWLKPRLALVASGGSYPIDPTQGFPGGRFVSVSVRLAAGRGRASQSSSVSQAHAESLLAKEESPVSSFTAVKDSLGSVTLRVNAPRAQLVEVSGDFTDWVPVRLEPASGGWWTVRLPIDRGKYQMNLRLDGGKWLVPPGLLSMLDEFGGSVGLLVVD
jgi:hypothetical protein